MISFLSCFDMELIAFYHMQYIITFFLLLKRSCNNVLPYRHNILCNNSVLVINNFSGKYGEEYDESNSIFI